MKKIAALLFSILLVVSATVSCVKPAKTNSESGNSASHGEQSFEKTENEKLVDALIEAATAYVSTEDFAASLQSTTTQSRLPLMYLKYLDGFTYGEAAVENFRWTLDLVERLIDDGKIDEALFDEDEILGEKYSYEWEGVTYYSYTRWSSPLDYTFTFSLVYNQYKQATGGDEYDKYIAPVGEYLAYLDGLYAADEYFYRGVPFGFSATDTILLTAANLGIETALPNSENALLAYYGKDEGGNFTAVAPQPNWNGFNGRPLAATLFVGDENYDETYEKTMQGYYPKHALVNYSPELTELVTLDELADNYTVTLGEWETYDPQYAILTALALGMNVKEYKAASGETKDIFSVWLKSIKTEDGYSFNTAGDLAIAIAYAANFLGVSRPSPIGLFNAENQVINVNK